MLPDSPSKIPMHCPHSTQWKSKTFIFTCRGCTHTQKKNQLKSQSSLHLFSSGLHHYCLSSLSNLLTVRPFRLQFTLLLFNALCRFHPLAFLFIVDCNLSICDLSTCNTWVVCGQAKGF